MKDLIIAIILIFCQYSALQGQPPVMMKDYFQSPVDFEIYLAANFGEIRSDHFHSGIDIKTLSRSGENIRAAAEGYVSRIVVSPVGFGKALYISHPNGHTTVYGHLSKFTPDIEAWVNSRQYESRSFDQNLFPPESRFPVEKGQLIGYSGNTGSSTGPHLHFEVRETQNQRPKDPLLFDFPIIDNISPIINGIFIYPIHHTRSIDNGQTKDEYKVRGRYGNYALNVQDPIAVPEKFGLGIDTYDLLNGFPNRCGIYSMEVILDGNRHSYLVFDEFSFSETRYVNSLIDYRERMINSRNIRKTFVEPNNRSRIYATLINKGVIHLTDNEVHDIKIIIKDSYQNTSSLSFSVQGNANPSQTFSTNKEDFLRIMPFDIENTYQMSGFEIDFPKYAFYDTIWFRLAITPSIENSFSRVYHVHDEGTPVHLYFTLRIQPDSILPGLESKLLLARVNENGKLIPQGGEWNDHFIELKTRNFGKYTVAIDTLSPSILPRNFRRNQNLANLSTLEFKITDDFSGIGDYEGYIDGKWALFEYDPKSDRLKYQLDAERIGRGKEHQLMLRVRDQRNNEQVFTMNFIW